MTVRALGDQGKVEWSTQLPLSKDSHGTPTTTGVLLDDFDNDGGEDLILWWDFDLWVLEPSTGELKQHAGRNGQVTSSSSVHGADQRWTSCLGRSSPEH